MSNIVTVNFRNDTLFAVERDDGVFVAIKPICDTLGLAWNRQRSRIQRDEILSEGGTMVVLPSPGGAQETLCLKLELINGWLFTIDHSRVKDHETRQKVLRYKRECYDVLCQHFFGKKIRHFDGEIDDLKEAPLSVRLRFVAEARQTFGKREAAILWRELNLFDFGLDVDGQLSFVDFRKEGGEAAA